MRMRLSAHPGSIHEPAHRVSILVVLLLALALLALSALIHAAAAATLGGGWPSLGAIWLIAIAAILVTVFRARSRREACRRMCFIDGLASLGLLTAGAVDLSGLGRAPDVVPPPGPVVGFAVASSVLVIAGLVLAAVFFAAWYLSSQHATGAHRKA